MCEKCVMAGTVVTARIRATAAKNLMMTEFIVDIKKLGLAVKNLLHILAP